jgi:NADH-quinone oxidoreductase subunit L
MGAGWLALSGVFPFSGFWSKDEILAATFAKGGWYIGLWVIGLFVALLTAFYMTRLFVMTFLGKPRWEDGVHPHESPATMTIPLIILGLFTVSFGMVNTPARLAFEHFLEASFEHIHHVEGLSIPTIVALATIALIVAIAGIVWGWLKYHRAELPSEDGKFWLHSRDAFGVDEFYGRTIVEPGRKVSEWGADVLDPKVLDGIAHGIGSGMRSFGNELAKLQTGQVRAYAGGIAISGIALIIIILAVGGGF